jgi:hypothetical protein
MYPDYLILIRVDESTHVIGGNGAAEICEVTKGLS